MAPWLDFGASELIVGAPITEELLIKFFSRDRGVVEGPAGGYWDSAIAAGTGNIQFLRLFVARGASEIHVECEALWSGTGNMTPQARLYATDGVTTSFGAYIAIDTSPYRRVQFPPIKIATSLRNKMVRLHYQPADLPTTQYSIRNLETSPTVGYGVRFG